jgi:hypothetical protein
MAWVADDLRRLLRERVLAMSPDERLAATERLAEADIMLFCSAHAATRETAKRVFMRRRQIGRRLSRVMQEVGE